MNLFYALRSVSFYVLETSMPVLPSARDQLNESFSVDDMIHVMDHLLKQHHSTPGFDGIRSGSRGMSYGVEGLIRLEQIIFGNDVTFRESLILEDSIIYYVQQKFPDIYDKMAYQVHADAVYAGVLEKAAEAILDDLAILDVIAIKSREYDLPEDLMQFQLEERRNKASKAARASYLLDVGDFIALRNEELFSQARAAQERVKDGIAQGKIDSQKFGYVTEIDLDKKEELAGRPFAGILLSLDALTHPIHRAKL